MGCAIFLFYSPQGTHQVEPLNGQSAVSYAEDVIKAIERVGSIEVVIKSLQLGKDMLIINEKPRGKGPKSGKPPYSPNPNKKHG